MVKTKNKITVQELYEQHEKRLPLSWIAGQLGNSKVILPGSGEGKPFCDQDVDAEESQATSVSSTKEPNEKSFVGYLSLIHPRQIQIIGGMELKYIEGLRDIIRHDAVKQLICHEPVTIILLRTAKKLQHLLKGNVMKINNVALFSSPISSTKLSEVIHYYLANLFAEGITIHGVFMEVTAIGVLITGPSEIGKSELALELISRGHRLIADDVSQFSRITSDIINGTCCPDALRDFLEVKGLWLLNIKKLYGNTAIKSKKYLSLIIRLESTNKEQMLKLDRLEGSYRDKKILDLDIPEITLPVAPGRSLAILLGCTARDHSLRMGDCHASQEFIDNQQVLIEKN